MSESQGESKSILVRSPLRIDLAGGTLDLWPLYLLTEGACVVNMAIDIYSEVEITPRQDSTVEFVCRDLSLHRKYPSLKEALQDDRDPRLRLLQLPLRVLVPLVDIDKQEQQQGFVLRASTQGPVIGGGLGGSSSLLTSLLRALLQWQGRSLSFQKLVELAVNIETALLGTPAGSQDHYPALSGGISILHYGFSGVRQELLAPTSLPWDFSDLSLLVYSGKAHHSGTNNFEVISRACYEGIHGIHGTQGSQSLAEKKTLTLLKELKAISLDMAETLRQGNKQRLSALFHREYDVRTRLNPAFESKEVKDLREWAMEKGGAEAVKICGAGGGGCLFIWCADVEKKQKVERLCKEKGYKVVPFRLVDVQI